MIQGEATSLAFLLPKLPVLQNQAKKMRGYFRKRP